MIPVRVSLKEALKTLKKKKSLKKKFSKKKSTRAAETLK
jgi:hypothetical protein